MAVLSKLDFTLGAIDRMAVRKGISRSQVETLLNTRVGLSAKEAAALAGHWFDAQYRHGGIAVRRADYLATSSTSA